MAARLLIGFSALIAGCGFAPADTAPPARPVAPLSTATVNVARPSLRFVLPAGGTRPIVELCRTRAFDAELRLATVDDSGTRAVPDADLEAGVWFWRVRTFTPGGPSTSAVWQLTRTQQPGAREASWGSALDVDGDGFAELAVGAASTTVGGNIGTGRVFVYAGGPNGPDLARVTVLDGPAPGGQFGRSLATVDFNGDGFADLAVGAPSEGTAGTGLSGKVYLYRGGPHGLSSTPDFALTTGDGGGVGSSLDGAGDVNGDGYGDLVAGAPLTKTNGALIGAAYVFYGDAGTGSGIATLRTGDGALAKVGLAVAGGSDLDGDGLADVVIGVPDAPMGTAGHGRAYIYAGSSIGFNDPRILDEASPTLSQFGSALTLAGDLDGDGFADLAVGAPGDGPGRVYVYAGRAGGAPVKVARLDGPDGQDSRFGSTLSSDDVDGDGHSDLAIGATCAPAGSDCPGRAYLVLAGSLTTIGATVTGPTAQSAYGIAVRLADHDGDGRADLTVGATAFQFDLGRVDWFRGGAPLDGTPRVLNGIDAKGRFGVSVR